MKFAARHVRLFCINVIHSTRTISGQIPISVQFLISRLSLKLSNPSTVLHHSAHTKTRTLLTHGIYMMYHHCHQTMQTAKRLEACQQSCLDIRQKPQDYLLISASIAIHFLSKFDVFSLFNVCICVLLKFCIGFI